ncbi:hypothetical protein XENOCAPTIV_025408 [Xenoophorus captivus]|uniref:Uncharacterized protein n=1 Tax=Xenoophorus captivus TaxID=1517983 RepID=A0ABV0RIW6_9TELE
MFRILLAEQRLTLSKYLKCKQGFMHNLDFKPHGLNLRKRLGKRIWMKAFEMCQVLMPENSLSHRTGHETPCCWVGQPFSLGLVSSASLSLPFFLLGEVTLRLRRCWFRGSLAVIVVPLFLSLKSYFVG